MRRASLGGLLAAVLLFGLPAGAGPVNLQDVRSGKTVALEPGAPALHVVFFATWCPPCVEELQRLVELKSRWGDGRYRLVLVAVQNRQSLAKLSGFLESRANLPGELLFDFEGQAERQWKAGDLPTHVVLDAAGHEVARAAALDPQIEAAIRNLLQAGRGTGRGRTP